MRRLINFSLLFLNLTIGSCLFAQVPMIRKISDSDKVLVDPRGLRPEGINMPLPIPESKTPAQAVMDHAQWAEYFIWKDDSGWISHHVVRRDMDEKGQLTGELYTKKGFPSGYYAISYIRNEQGLITNSREEIRETPEGWMLPYRMTSRSFDQDGRLVSTVMHEGEHGSWKELNRYGFIYHLNEKKEINRVDHTQSENRAGFQSFEIQYEHGKPSSIIQSAVDTLNDIRLKNFRFDHFRFEGDQLCGFSTSVFEDDRWVSYRADSSHSGLNPTSRDYYSKSVYGTDKGAIDHCAVITDHNDNLVYFLQRTYDAIRGEWDTVGCIHFMTTYLNSTREPQSVVSSYLDEKGNWNKSFKVVYNQRGEFKPDALSLKQYPNPATKQVTLLWDLQLQGKGTVEITNQQGQRFIKKEIADLSAGAFTIDLSDIPSGNYITTLSTQEYRSSAVLAVTK